MISEKECEVCGIVDGRVCGKRGQFKMDLCSKHSNQMYQYGKILERTRFDPNEFIINGDITEIVLYNSNNVESGRALIDTKYTEKVSQRKWSITTGGYIHSNNSRGKATKLHRFITNAPKGMVVDHVNHNVADNREINLRLCSNTDNCRNLALGSNNTSGYTGVCWVKSKGKWKAAIMVNRKSIHLGLFLDINDAITVRHEAEIKYFGEFRYKGESA